jgi:hypothetical protein
MLNKLTVSGLYPNIRKTVLILFATGVLCSQTSCKDDDNRVFPDDQTTDPAAIIPVKEKKFYYKVSEADGSFYTESIRVKSITDSAGIKVSNLETRMIAGEEEVVLDWKAYSHNGVTTYEIPMPTALSELLAQIEQLGTVKDFKITGFPQFQSLENKASVGSKVTFRGDDLKMKVKLEVEDDEGEILIVEVESTMKYNNGQLTKLESLTTPAGTFSCAKWEYRYNSSTKVFYNGQLSEHNQETYAVTQWTATGIGVVKSIEKSDDSESNTELQSIE